MQITLTGLQLNGFSTPLLNFELPLQMAECVCVCVCAIGVKTLGQKLIVCK